MDNAIQSIIKVIDDFLNQDFKCYSFNTLSCKDIRSFKLLEPENTFIQNSNDKNLSSNVYVKHYFTKVKKTLQNLSRNTTNSDFNEVLQCFKELLNNWINSAITSKTADTQYLSSLNYDRFNGEKQKIDLIISIQELISLHEIYNGIIDYFNAYSKISRLKFSMISDHKYCLEQNSKILRLTEDICNLSSELNSYCNTFNKQESHIQSNNQYTYFNEKLQLILNQCLKLRNEYQLYIRILELKTSNENACKYQQLIQTYQIYINELNNIYIVYENLKQNLEVRHNYHLSTSMLTSVFDDTQKQLQQSTSKHWKYTFMGAIVAIIFADISALFIIPSNFPSILDDKLYKYLLPLCLAAPFIWIAWFTARNINLENRLKYKYIDKLTLTKTYALYSIDNKNINSDISKEALKNIFTPVNIPWNYNEPSTPIEAILKNRNTRQFLMAILSKADASSNQHYSSSIKSQHKHKKKKNATKHPSVKVESTDLASQ